MRSCRLHILVVDAAVGVDVVAEVPRIGPFTEMPWMLPISPLPTRPSPFTSPIKRHTLVSAEVEFSYGCEVIPKSLAARRPDRTTSWRRWPISYWPGILTFTSFEQVPVSVSQT